MKPAVTVLSGFLGSGKTTLINRLTSVCTPQETALIINDFGEVNLDTMLLENNTLRGFSLSGGCICCSIRGNLTQMIQELCQQSNIKEIIIESSGIADPSAILSTLLSPLVKQHIELHSVITVIDGEHFTETLESQKALLTAQIKTATTVLLNKKELCTDKRVEEIKSTLWQINPELTVIPTSYCAVNPSLLMPVAHISVEDLKEETTVDSLNIDSLSIPLRKGLTPTELKSLLRKLDRRIYRAKAVLQSSNNKSIAIHKVGRRITEEQLVHPVTENLLVLIGEKSALISFDSSIFVR